MRSETVERVEKEERESECLSMAKKATTTRSELGPDDYDQQFLTELYSSSPCHPVFCA